MLQLHLSDQEFYIAYLGVPYIRDFTVVLFCQFTAFGQWGVSWQVKVRISVSVIKLDSRPTCWKLKTVKNTWFIFNQMPCISRLSTGDARSWTPIRAQWDVIAPQYDRVPSGYGIVGVQVYFPHSLFRCGWLWMGDNLCLLLDILCLLRP